MISRRKSQHLESASLHFPIGIVGSVWKKWISLESIYRIYCDNENIIGKYLVGSFCDIFLSRMNPNIGWPQTKTNPDTAHMGGNKNVPPFVHGQSMVPENAVISISSLTNLPSWFIGCKANISLFKTGTKMSIPWLFTSHAAKPCSFWVYGLNKKVFVA